MFPGVYWLFCAYVSLPHQDIEETVGADTPRRDFASHFLTTGTGRGPTPFVQEDERTPAVLAVWSKDVGVDRCLPLGSRPDHSLTFGAVYLVQLYHRHGLPHLCHYTLGGQFQ